MQKFNHGASATNARRDIIYYPTKRPGFVAWATAFDYGNGSIGLSFKETLCTENKSFSPPRLEMGEAVGAPVSYCSVECGSAVEESYRVYMATHDNGKTFVETGRCQLEQGSFCNAGFVDGRIIGFDVPRINDKGTGWCDYIDVRESHDGGSTWTRITKLLNGTAPYLWRSRRLSDGTIILLASLYGTPWGEGLERSTRNTMLPGETYLNKIQTFFMTTTNGREFKGPHYILPGIGAHEYDVVECNNGDLLFIAGDVQATPTARQRVQRRGDTYINGTLYKINRGAPQDPSANPQGGIVPESTVMLPDGLIVGARRNKPYSVSNDFGESWYELDNLPTSLYQPYMLLMPNNSIINFGHYGGDAAFGQEDMYIGADIFEVDNKLPRACTLTLSRKLSTDKSHYENNFFAQLENNGKYVSGQELSFSFMPVWNQDGTVNTNNQGDALIVKNAITDENGVAQCDAFEFNNIPDIHYYYNASVVYRPKSTSYRECDGPMLCVAALMPYRNNKYPYSAYLAEGTLYISPTLISNFPDCIDILSAMCGYSEVNEKLPQALLKELIGAHVIREDGALLKWYASIHNEKTLDKVLLMAEGDLYV